MQFITKKVIKGNDYHYLQYEGSSMLLGRLLPPDLKEQMLYFFQDVGKKKFSNFPANIKSSFRYGNLEILEAFHYWYICLNHELFAHERQDFMKWFTILFTFNSNRAEGSKVSRPEIEKFFDTHIRKPKTKTDQEIFNSFLALEYALSSKMKWNMKNIKTVHFLLLQNLDPLIAGDWKKENNVAPGSQPTAPFSDVPKKMKALLEWLKRGVRERVYPPLLAIRFYCQFEAIHPFLDGNGRVGRILFNAILHQFKYPPLIFFTSNFREHCSAITQALEGRYTKMNKHVLGQAKKTYNELGRLFK